MQCDRSLDDGGLVRHAFVVEAGAAAGPKMGRSVEKRGIDRRGRCRIADSHFTEAQKIDIRRNGVHAEFEGRNAILRAHRRGKREIFRRPIECEFEDFQIQAEARADLVDGSASSGEISDHLLRHFGGKGRHPLARDAMIAGKNADEHVVEPGRTFRLPGRQPFYEFLEPAKAAGRLGELPVAPTHKLDGGRVRA
jgi:hypothetical protein